jgi:plasmid stabilization system protein ParE
MKRYLLSPEAADHLDDIKSYLLEQAGPSRNAICDT